MRSQKNVIQILRKSPIDWLLQWSNPSVRYLTLKDILGKSENDQEVMTAKSAIPSSPIVAKIMAKQKVEGYWEDPASPYFPKYKSSYWQIMILGQLRMGKNEKRVRKACEHVFQFQQDEGGFSCYSAKQVGQVGTPGLLPLMKEYEYLRKKGKKLPPLEEWSSEIIHEYEMSCLTGNVAAALIRIGYKNDARVKKALRWLVKIQNEDGGWLCPYWRAHIKDIHGCFYGTICPLEAFSEIPKQELTEEMKRTIENGAEFLLMHRLFKADHHDYRVINQSWLKLGFPWFYGYNILRGLDVLTKLGYTEDDRILDAVQILLRKRRDDCRWIIESTPTGRMQANIEAKGKPSKWITSIALRVLKRLSEK